ncbi:MAG: 6,7-dimethyl-8-ribityllumazine synthase [bacterium]
MKSNAFQNLKAGDFNIAIVKAKFNCDVTDNLVEGALRALKQAGVKSGNIKIVEVPGTFEIPFACQRLALGGKYRGIITIGAVIKGETAHFEYISGAAVEGIMRVMLETKTPISLGVITVYNYSQAKARSKSGKTNKGYEAAMALIEMMLNK